MLNTSQSQDWQAIICVESLNYDFKVFFHYSLPGDDVQQGSLSTIISAWLLHY